LLGATTTEQGRLATARDRVEELRRTGRGRAGIPAGLPGRAGTTAGSVVPRQLPPAAAYFTGRGAELARLTSLVDRASGGGTVVISAIDGTAGIGKTAHELGCGIDMGSLRTQPC